jgi:murein endopeptidase
LATLPLIARLVILTPALVCCATAVGACGWRDLSTPQKRITQPRIEWKRSVAVGSPASGRLVRGVRLPREGRHFFTWDPVRRRSPNRPWRRYGTGRLVGLILRVAREYHRAHPRAARMAVGDLSRPRGGDFGPRFGYIGHASHQNGLDVDVYYPRADGRERAPRNASEIDRALSQELVDRFVAAGAQTVFVGPNTTLTGPPGVVAPLVNHDNHIHVRTAG